MAMTSCIFCKIARNEMPAKKIYEDERFVCVQDIHPQARVHLLVIPREHVATLDAAFPEQGDSKTQLMGEMLGVAVKLARQQGLLPKGFRTVVNTGEDGGQTVFHLHLHVLGGEHLKASFA